ncbi:MAG: hypothetical protein AAF065_10280 [Verrucomicrobiota bacterium]
MHPDDDSQTTLSKWPFILGDILLVTTALAIAILGEWQLTEWQIASCVIAVALGAALFVLPYIVEYQVRVREEQEDRAGDLRVLERHVLSAEQAIDGIDARIRALEAAAASAASAGEPNFVLADVFGQKLEQLAKERAAQDNVIGALEKEIEALPNKIPVAFDPAILEPLQERLTALEKRPVASLPKEIPVPVKTADLKAEDSPGPPARKKVLAKPKKTVSQIERPKRSTRERHKPEESRLLNRAIKEKQDSSSSAVSRIIESSPQEELVEKKSPQAPKKEAVESSKEEASQPAPEKKETPAKVAKPEPKEETIDLNAEVPVLDSSDMLFDEPALTSPARKTRAKKTDAVLTASVFIGIGNKPYLRGNGAGLNWDKGVAMEFQEIGKWRWVASPDLDGELEVQLYRNDEDPDKSGKYKLKPGQKLEVSPVF